MKVELGEVVEYKGRRVTVTPTAHECLPLVRGYLVRVARSGEVVTYGDLRDDLGLPYAATGMGRLLDLVSIDCFRRSEPSLAALVVSASTGEVGSDFDGDAAAQRRDLSAFWSGRRAT